MKTFEVNEDLPAEDPGNQLRAKLNGQGYVATPTGFNELIHTASERGLLIDGAVDNEDALVIARLFLLAQSIDKMPNPAAEIARVRM